MPDIIITPSTGKLEFVDNSAQNIRKHAFSMDEDGISIDAPLAAPAIKAPLNIINVTVNNSNVNYPFVLASGSAETGIKTLMMDGSGGTYNPFTNTATIDVSGNSATTTLASNSTQLNGQSDSYYTNIPARLGYTPVNKAGDTVTGNLIINGNFTVNGATTLFSASNVYISSSQLYIEDNILTLNAFSPYLRYAGVEMYDSGSGTLSSLLWDGEADYFFLSGSSVNGKIITGPDGQTNLTANYVPKATAGYKLGNSLIYDNGTNVGIGTTSPSQLLHIVGTNAANNGITIQNTNASGNSQVRFLNSSGTEKAAITYVNSADAVYHYTTNGGNLFNLVGNNVGIGTTLPASRLHVDKSSQTLGSSTPSGATIISNLAGHNAILELGVDTTNFSYIQSRNVTDQTYYKLLLNPSGGSVGIGTTSPAYKLDVGASGGDVISVRLTPGYERVRFHTFDLLGYNDGNLWMIGNNPTNTLVLGKTWDWDNQIGISYTPGTVGNSGGILQIGQISKNNANYTHGIIRLYTNGLERITVIANGNVGIGSTSPANRFEVVGSTFNRASFIATANVQTGIQIQRTGGVSNTNWEIYSPASSGDLRIHNGADYVTFKSGSGWVGIGTTSPADKLQVGAGHISIDAGYKYYMDANVGAVAIRKDGTSMVFTVGATDKVYINESGNVGIGTSSPSQLLHVYKSNSGGLGGAIMIDNNNLAVANETALMFGDGGVSNIRAAISSTTENSPYYGDLKFKTGLSVYSSLTTRMIIKGDGNVGIGTASPSGKLEVRTDAASTYIFSGSSTSGYATTFTMDDTASYFGHDSSVRSLILRTNSTARLTVKGDGNVGIGTTNPSAKLDIYISRTSSTNGIALLLNDNVTGAQTDGVYKSIRSVSNGGNSISEIRFLETDGTNNNTGISFATANVAGGLTERMRVGPSGNVGIGTTSPSVKLHVDGFFISKTLWSDVAAHSYWGNYPTAYGRLTWDTGLAWINATAGNVLYLGADGGNKHVTIATSGNVGIGTTSPTATLQVGSNSVSIVSDNSVIARIGGSSAGARVFNLTLANTATATTNNESALSFIVAGNYSATAIISAVLSNTTAAQTDLVFTNYNNGLAERMRINSVGNVGIGTTSPSSKLHIDDATAPYITITRAGVPTWQLRNNFPSNQYGFSFNNTTAGTVPLFIGTGGNIGIGLDNPTVKLDIASTQGNGIVMRYDTSTAYQAWIRPYWNSGTDSRIDFAINRTANVTPDVIMSVGYGGNVGIGTTIPTARLDVRPNTPTAAYQGTVPYQTTTAAILSPVMAAASTDTYTSILQLVSVRQALVAGRYAHGYLGFSTVDNSNINGILDAGRISIKNDDGIGSLSATSMGFWTNTGGNASGAATERVRIASDGNVGIGTSSPSSRVHIYENANRVTYITQNNNHTARFEAYGTATAIDTTASNGIFFRMNGSDVVKFAADGNVGIGTTNATAKLDVRGQTFLYNGASNALQIQTTVLDGNTRDAIYLFENDSQGSGRQAISWYNGNQSYYKARIWTEVGSSYAATVFGIDVADDARTVATRLAIRNGNVGIGTTGPATKLEVYGVVRVSESSSGGILQLTAGASAIDIASTFYGGSRRPITFTMDGEKVRIDTNGNVGIGTTTGTFTLNVYNNADVWHAKFGSATGELRIGGQTSSGAVIQSFVPGSGTVRDLYIQRDGGNVGIGTSNATAKLESYFASNALTINYLATNLNGNSPIPSYGFSVTDGSAETRSIKAGIGYERHETNGRGTLHFYNRTTNDTASISGNRSSAGDIKMSLNNNGNVGIGSTSPVALLNIRASAPTGTGAVTTGTNVLIDSNTSNYITFRNTSDNGTYAGLVFLDNNVGGYIAFGNSGAAVGSDSMIYGSYNDHIFQNGYVNETLYNRTETMRIKQNGYVGIGSTSPGYKLDVVGDINFSSTLKFGGINVISNSSGDVYLNGRVIRNESNTSQDGMYIGYNSGGTTNAHIRFYANAGNERMRIQANDGNVGIGTTSAGKKLDVEGIVRTRGASGTGGFEIGAATTGAAKWRIEWDSASDSLDFNWVG
jgi:hypothetical protein